jgi:hypothetical protein
MRSIGIGALILGWLLVHGWPAKAGQPAISDIVAGVVVDITAQLIIGRLLNNFSNDNVAEHNNVWVGFQTQGPCNPRMGSQVPGGRGFPCVPNIGNPAFGAGLQKLTGLSANDCDLKAMNGAQAILGTHVRLVQAIGVSGVSFGPRAELNNLSPGGICDGGGHYSFVGTLEGVFLLGNPSGLSGPACAYLVNMCTGQCSCGLHFYPGP